MSLQIWPAQLQTAPLPPAMRTSPPSAPWFWGVGVFSKGDKVVYWDSARGAVRDAVVLSVDKALQPPAYEISVAGSNEPRNTEGIRLAWPTGWCAVTTAPLLMPAPCPKRSSTEGSSEKARFPPDELACNIPRSRLTALALRVVGRRCAGAAQGGGARFSAALAQHGRASAAVVELR